MSKEQQIITSTIMIDISDFHEKYIGGKVVTFYTVNVYDNFSRKKWTLTKRYSEFEALHKNLSKLIPNVPSIPGKSLFKIKSSDGLTKRKNHLESFLHQCVNRKDIMASDYIKEFLELDRHSPNLTFNSPEKKYEVTELPLGIRDFFYFGEESMMFAVCSDMNIASRVDSYITNVNLPWEKANGEHMTVGAIFAFKLNFGVSNPSDIFDKRWAQSFPIQTGVVNYNIEKSILMVGLDNGKIYLYQTGIDSKYCNYDILYEGKPHTARIMGIDIDQKKNVAYTCSTDKKFIMTFLIEQKKFIEVETNYAGFTNLFFDRMNERLFLTNEIGQVNIYLTNEEIPVCIKVVQTHSKNILRGLEVSTRKYYIFTSSMKGDISVLDLGTIGREKFVEEISYFGGDLQMRVIRYNEENSELLTGDQSGRVTVWSLKNGKSIYAWKAHEGAITQMNYDSAHKILITGGKDKKIIFWKLPEKWVNEDIERFEKDEIKNLNDTMAMLRLQKALEKKDNDSSSDDDSLDGWDIRP
jgi:WD40 repeat protein